MYDLEHVEEVDYQTIRSRKMKWTAFLASVLVFLLSVAGMLGAMAGKKSATMETYGYYLNQAQNASGQEFVDMIKQAVDIDPGRVDAYEMLLDWVESDGKLDLRTEWSPINQLLMNTSSGQRVSNDQMLYYEAGNFSAGDEYCKSGSSRSTIFQKKWYLYGNPCRMRGTGTCITEKSKAAAGRTETEII